MTNALYPKGKEYFLLGIEAWALSPIRCCLVRGYTYNPAHSFRADVISAGGVIVASSNSLSSKTYANGVAGAANVTFANVPAGDPITSLLLYWESGGTDTVRRLLAYIDSGLPITPDGTSITVQWDTVNKIFSL